VIVSPPGSADDLSTKRLVRALVIAALALAVVGLLWVLSELFGRVHNTLTVIIFSILFGYLVYPPIKWLGNRHVPIPLAAILVYVLIGGIGLAAAAWLAPVVALQVEDLTRNFPAIVSDAQRQIADPKHAPLLAHLPASLRSAIAANTGKLGAAAAGLAVGFGSNALGVLSGTTAAVIDIFLVLGLTLLIIGDLVAIQRFGIRLVPLRYRAEATSFMNSVDAVIGGFVRGQVLLALAVGLTGTIVLLLTGVPYAVLLGLVAGAFSIIPLIGPIVAALFVLLIAFFTVSLLKVAIVAALYVAILAVQQNVLTPLVVSRSVGVTPLVVFVALLFGSESFGILGALLAIPIAGILQVVADRLFPPDPDADARLQSGRDLAGEPPGATRAALKET
jgi:predicted PurR-regulated permease PerM